MAAIVEIPHVNFTDQVVCLENIRECLYRNAGYRFKKEELNFHESKTVERYLALVLRGQL